MRQSEASFQRRVLRDLKREFPDAWVYKAADRAKKGIPDILLCLSGYFVALELKAEDGKGTLLQQHTLGLIGRAGGVALIVLPSIWEKTLADLRFLLKRK